VTREAQRLQALARFDRLIDRSGGADACWLFVQGQTDKGYGRIRVVGRPWYGHRLAWTLAFGTIPDGLFVCHRCDNPPCVNPAHLFLGSNEDNLHDMWRKGRGYAKAALTPYQIAMTRATRTPAALERLAAEWGVSVRTLYRARKPSYGQWAVYRGQVAQEGTAA
jgi:hypothetical protein